MSVDNLHYYYRIIPAQFNKTIMVQIVPYALLPELFSEAKSTNCDQFASR